jgi:hypothetical protein
LNFGHWTIISWSSHFNSSRFCLYHMAVRLRVELSEPTKVLQISNLLHYHPARAPLLLDKD